MNKILSGKDLADYIKLRQSKEVRSISQSLHVIPKLAIIQCKDDPAINTYVKLKKAYGTDIGVDVEVFKLEQSAVQDKIKDLNKEESVHGIIVQLPLEDETETTSILNLVDRNKDVDALGSNPVYDPATPNAILWLLAGYNVDIKNSKVLLVGRGKLVGGPLEKMLLASNIDLTVVDITTTKLKEECLKANIIITATGQPGLITSDMIKPKTVIVDAGTASDKGVTVGDLDDSVYEMDNIVITPKKGGVGPLTVCSLFENVIKASRTKVA